MANGNSGYVFVSASEGSFSHGPRIPFRWSFCTEASRRLTHHYQRGSRWKSSIKALIVKKFKDTDLALDVGRHFIDETVVVRISGTVERRADQWILPTISVPPIPTFGSR